MGTILSILIPGLLLAYYLRNNSLNIKPNRILKGMLISGVLVFYLGLLFNRNNPAVGSLLKLGGACLFFTGVAYLSVKRPENTPDGKPDQDEANQ